jgi:exopolyphosphatase/guanosine-5'-triphosphate,3'-diphosphate pyrophosphatase
VRRACIDIGSNTTRLLVADCDSGQLDEVHQERVFTRLSGCLGPSREIGQSKIDEVCDVVAAQRRAAEELGASDVWCVATAAIRRASNGSELASAIKSSAGLELQILSAEDEARLAFVGAARTMDRKPETPFGVVDVGGGSSELVVGTPPDHVSWSWSFEVGSGDIADEFLKSDPPSESELGKARNALCGTFSGVAVPRPKAAVAVGGSATSLRRLTGARLDSGAFGRTLALLLSAPTQQIAKQFELDPERVRLLAGGMLILEEASRAFATELEIGRGGLREGVLLEMDG